MGTAANAVIENRRHLAALSAVLVVAAVAALLVGRGSGDGRVEASPIVAQQALPPDNAAPHAKVVVAPKKVPNSASSRHPPRLRCSFRARAGRSPRR
jgi:hypothetical protein